MSNKLYGNISGLGSSEQKTLERIYRRKLPSNFISTHQFNRELCGLSHQLGKKLGVLVNRRGDIEYVIVGEERLIFFEQLKKERVAPTELRGLRLLQTCFKNEEFSRQELADLILLKLDLLLKVKVDENGYPGLSYLVHLKPDNQTGQGFEFYPAFAPGQLELNFQELVRALEEEFARSRIKNKSAGQEGVILVKVVLSKKKGARIDKWRMEQETQELWALARSAGVAVLDSVVQHREHYHSRYLVGEGKLEEITIRAMQLGAETLVFDHELSPAQINAIEDYTGLKAVDRSQLILDIFAQRAQSREGKIQVELAQYRYLLPRLVGLGREMSQLVGGIGTRGPGETKLEIDRRKIKERIRRLEGELEQVRRARSQRRALRTRRQVRIVSIVGYTNAGKSTLLNALTNSQVRVEDKLFATLDPTTRRLRFPRERELIITDTVGFIRNLPKELFSAFRATLEELEDADLLIHIADSSSPELEEQIQTVEKIISELGLEQKLSILALNKIDLIEQTRKRLLFNRFPEAVMISALEQGTFMPLLLAIEEKLWLTRTETKEAWELLGYSGKT